MTETWADLLPFMTLGDIELALGEDGMIELRKRLAVVLPGRDPEALITDGSARPSWWRC